MVSSKMMKNGSLSLHCLRPAVFFFPTLLIKQMSSKRSWYDGPENTENGNNNDEMVIKCIKAQKLMGGRHHVGQTEAAK